MSLDPDGSECARAAIARGAWRNRGRDAMLCGIALIILAGCPDSREGQETSAPEHGRPRVTDAQSAIAAVTRTRHATDLAKRVRLHLHIEDQRAYGYVVYYGEDHDDHTVLVMRLLVKEDGSVWDSADTDWDEKSFTIPLE